MATQYPNLIDSFTNPSGTNTLDSPDHATQHININGAVIAIQNVLGITAGTSVLKNFSAGLLSASTAGIETFTNKTLLDANNHVAEDFKSKFANFVSSGLTIPTSGTLASTSVAGVLYYNGVSVSIASDGGHTYTASKDTYVDVSNTGSYAYNAVANGAAAPTLTASSIRIAKVITSGSAVTSVTQSGYDSNGVPIYPINPTVSPYLGYASITSPFTTTTVNAFVDVTNLTVNVTPVTGRGVKLTVFCPGLKTDAGTGTAVSMAVLEGTTVLGQGYFNEPVNAYNIPFTLIAYVPAPTAGSHTYKVSIAQNSAGTLTFGAGTSATPTSQGPAILLVEAI